MKKEISFCYLCGKKATNALYGLKNYRYCEKCSLGWLEKIKLAEYTDSYYKGKSSLASILFSPLPKFFYKIRSAYARKKNIDTWIDVGAGEGGFLKTVRAKRKIGVEISQAGRKIMEGKGLETLTDREFLVSKGLCADVISFWHVLEHVEKPWEYLEVARKNLKKEGEIIVGIPNIDSFEFKLSKKFWFHLQPQFHLWYFTPKSFEKLLHKTGFKIDKIDYWSLEHHPTGVLQSFINKSSNSTENVLHKMVKRGTRTSLKKSDVLWSIFWLTGGLPIVLIFWIIGAIFKKPGTFVAVASLNK